MQAPAAVTPTKVAASKKRAAKKGPCKAPKGKVCVDKSVGMIGRVKRRGCIKAKQPGVFHCTKSALAQKKAGKNVRVGKRAGSGLKIVGWKAAINTSNNKFKPGCSFSLKLHKPVCKTKRSA